MSATGDRSRAGTTLLEALVVLSIFAMTAGLIFPTVERTLDVLALRQSATVLTANLRSARAQALRTGETMAFGVSPDGTAYGWAGRAERNLPRNQTVALSGVERVLFYGDGTANGGVVAVKGGGRRIDIHVDPGTGAAIIAR